MTRPDTPPSTALHATTPRTLTTAELEQVYDDLASAVDAAGEHSEKMLAKLALMLAAEVADPARVRALIAVAAQDL